MLHRNIHLRAEVYIISKELEEGRLNLQRPDPRGRQNGQNLRETGLLPHVEGDAPCQEEASFEGTRMDC